MVRYEFYKSQNYNHFSVHPYRFLLVNFTRVIFPLACHNGICWNTQHSIYWNKNSKGQLACLLGQEDKS